MFQQNPNCKWVNNNNENNADEDDEDNNDNNNRKRRSLSFSPGVLFIAEYTGNLEGEHCFGFSSIFWTQ